MKWKEVLDTKVGLWIDKHLSTDNSLHGSGTAVQKVECYSKFKKTAESSSDGDLTCHEFSLEDVAAHLAAYNPSRILAIKK